MAGFAVIVRRSGEEVPAAVVEPVRRSLEHRAPDGIEVAFRDNVAVVYGRLHATPEARFERQPHECPDGTWLVADARVDNRAELMERLGKPSSSTPTTDVELLAALYQRVGDAAPADVLGDFSVVAVHPDGRLVCMRDQLGVKPLYYWVGDDWVMIASELRQITAHPDAPRVPNPAVLGEFLSGWVESTTATVVHGVFRLPAAHVMTIYPRGVQTHRYWTPSFDEPLELADPAEYEERFLSLFTEAVQCRLRAPGPVGSELSGGLDSTSVTSMASRLTRAQRVAAADVLAFSCIFPWSGRADEGEYIRAAVAHIGVDWTAVVDDGERKPWVLDDAAFSSDIPLPPDGPAHVELCRSARDRGCSVVLTGHGGDHWFDPSAFTLLDLVQDLRLPTAWRFARAYEAPRRTAALMSLIKDGVAPHRPSWMPRPGATPRAPAVIGEARAKARLDVRRAPGRLPKTFRRLRGQRHFQQCAGGYDAMSLEIFDRIAARSGMEFRHPYFDRRLVEFGCRVPVTVHTTPSLSRRLQRRALRGVLPPAIADRQSKARFSEVWLRTIEQNLPSCSWPATEVARRGWVDVGEARIAMERTQTAIASPWGAGDIYFVWGLLQVEAVLQAL